MPARPASAPFFLVTTSRWRASGDRLLSTISTSSPSQAGPGARVGSALRQRSSWLRCASRRSRSVRRVSRVRSCCSRRASGLGGAAGSFSALSEATCTVPPPAFHLNQSLPARQSTPPSAAKSGRDSAAAVRVSWTRVPVARSRTKTSPLRTKTVRRRCGSYTGSGASRSARSASATLCSAPPSIGWRQVSRTGLPSRLSSSCAWRPSQLHQARSTGGPIQSGSAMACSIVNAAVAGAAEGAWASAGAAGRVANSRGRARNRGRLIGRRDRRCGKRSSVAARPTRTTAEGHGGAFIRHRGSGRWRGLESRRRLPRCPTHVACP